MNNEYALTCFRDGRGYIPLNSLTLGKHAKTGAEEKTKKQQAWWQLLPKEKVNQNKVIREKLESIENTVPEWPWMKGGKKQSSHAGPQSSVYTTVPTTTTELTYPTSTQADFSAPSTNRYPEWFMTAFTTKRVPTTSTTTTTTTTVTTTGFIFGQLLA